MDRRQQKTRQAILAAFRSLLEEKSFAKITVQEIIDTANIGRSTFYAHFETKEDLLKEVCDELFGHLVSAAIEHTHTHGSFAADEIPTSVCCHLLHHLSENDHNVLGLLSGENSELFLRYFKNSLNRLIEAYFLGHYSPKGLSLPKDFLINHISGSFVEMVLWWIKGKCAQTPEELTAYFAAVIEPVMTAGQK